MISQEKLCCMLQSERRKNKAEKYCQRKIYEIYMLAWNYTPSLAQSNSSHQLKQLQEQLKSNKNWFLSYLILHDWNRVEEDIYIKQRIICTMAIYLAYDKSLHPLEQLHIQKYYIKNMTTIDKSPFTEIAQLSYLQNSLYENGKTSYVKK